VQLVLCVTLHSFDRLSVVDMQLVLCVTLHSFDRLSVVDMLSQSQFLLQRGT
jgi:hypothetical protein